MRTLVLNCTILIAILAIFVDCKVDFTYNNKIAYTEDGLECLNNCINGKCVVDNTLLPHDCQNTDKDVPVHRTIYDTICLSRCWKDPVYTGRCYIDNDGNTDYCESSRTVEWTRDLPFTEYNGPCKDACRPDHRNGRPKCNHYGPGIDHCDPKFGSNYLQARTIKGKRCNGMCKHHSGRRHRWCADNTSNETPCAFPGMPRPRDWSKEIEDLLKIRKPICIRVINQGKFKSGEDNENSGLLDKLAQDHESNPYYEIVFLRDNLVPVYSYTFQEENIVLPLLPKVLRATIRPRDLVYRGDADSYLSLRERENLRRMGERWNDKVGYLVSYSLNGPPEKYNLFTKTRKATDYDEDSKIVKFLEDNKHQLDTKVELLAVVLYRGAETRPSGIARHVKFYHSGALADEYYEYLPNDSGDDTGSLAAIGEKSLLPAVDITRELANGDCYSHYYDDPLLVTEEPKLGISLRSNSLNFEQ